MQDDSGMAAGTGLQRELAIQAFRWMITARALDDSCASLYRAGKIHGGVFLGRGQEALSVSIGISLRKGDVFAPLIRDLAGRLVFGETMVDALRTTLGSALGPMRGRDGNVHRGRPRDGLYPMISHLGAMISTVNGALMARRMIGESGVVGATCLGDGGTSTGAFHEALNQAAVEHLPLVLIIADNQYAYSTHTSRQFACQSLADRAIGYGIRGTTVDGTDLFACLEVVGDAVNRARAGQGPQMVVGTLLRLCGHGEHDDAGYVDPELKKARIGRDCLKYAEKRLLEKGWISLPEIESWRQEVSRQIAETTAMVQREAGPDPFREDWAAISTRHLLEVRGT